MKFFLQIYFQGKKITLTTAGREFRVEDLFPSSAGGSYTISYHCNLKYYRTSAETGLLLMCVFFTQRQVLLCDFILLSDM